MVVKASGSSLAFSEIETEFGANPGRSLGRYRNSHADFGNKNVGELSDLPLDTGIPKTGQIKFSDFYGKRLNIVVDCFSAGSTNYNLNAYSNRFSNGSYRIVGNYRTSIVPSQWQGGKKVIIHINNTFGSSGATNRNDVAFDMGNQWPAATTYSIDVGSSGKIVGKGGQGGEGGDDNGGGRNNGTTGTSAMKIKSGLSPNITGGGAILAGGGGGGGGSGEEQNDWWDKNSAGGGGGGGGAGLPAGSGGNGGNPGGGNGGNGTMTTGGEGGEGHGDAEAQGKDGGDGGGNGASGNAAPSSSGSAGGTGGNQYVFF